MSIFDRLLKKKKKEDVDRPINMLNEESGELPDDLKKFKLPSPNIPETKRRSPLEKMPEPEGGGFLPKEYKDLEEGSRKEAKTSSVDRLDMILQKLETIEQRLKVIEHKIER